MSQQGIVRRLRCDDVEPIGKPPNADRILAKVRAIAEQVRTRMCIPGERDGSRKPNGNSLIGKRSDRVADRGNGSFKRYLLWRRKAAVFGEEHSKGGVQVGTPSSIPVLRKPTRDDKEGGYDYEDGPANVEKPRNPGDTRCDCQVVTSRSVERGTTGMIVIGHCYLPDRLHWPARSSMKSTNEATLSRLCADVGEVADVCQVFGGFPESPGRRFTLRLGHHLRRGGIAAHLVEAVRAVVAAGFGLMGRRRRRAWGARPGRPPSPQNGRQTR